MTAPITVTFTEDRAVSVVLFDDDSLVPIDLVFEPSDASILLSPIYRGPPGIDGIGAASIERQFTGSLGIVNHNFGRHPQVEVFSAGGLFMWTEVLHMNTNQVQVTVNPPQTFFVLCS